jgi:sRNA-binding protein
MKINEITNAEDILALWKLISDNTWSAIQQQAEQQAREKAERAAKTKSTKGSKRGTGRKPPPIVVPKPKPPARPAKPQAKPAVIDPVQQPLVAQGPLPSKGPLGVSQAPVDPTTTSLPTKPVAPSADAQQKQGTELKLSAREKGFVRK